MSGIIYNPMLAVIANYLSSISEKQQQSTFYEHDEYYLEEDVNIVEETTILTIESTANSSTTTMQTIKHPLLAVLFALFCIITVVVHFKYIYYYVQVFGNALVVVA